MTIKLKNNLKWNEEICKFKLDVCSPQTSTAVLEDGSNDDNNSRFWTINGDGEFTVARRPPLYSLRLKREACSLDEGVYDEPITDRKNSCNKLYAVVSK